MKIFKLFSIFIIISIIIISCKSPEKILPKGIAKNISTKGDDLGPAQKPDSDKSKDCDPCMKERYSTKQDNSDGVKSSADFLFNMLGADVYAQIEPGSLFFLTDTKGYFSTPHPPDENSAALMNIPIGGKVGGTDIFEFYQDKGTTVYKNIGTPVNSIYWDSHPTAAMDENCKQVLIWSSDREHPFFCFSGSGQSGAPMSYSGHTDLYFAFRDKDGKWGEVHNFSVTNSNINSESNDEPPFIFCNCHKPYLIFSSNRSGDYNIYYAQINIDYENETITVIEDAKQFPAGADNINSNTKDFYPFVPYPFSEKGAENTLYFSSYRFQEKYKIDEKHYIQNIGKSDIYSFPLNLDCKPPKIFLNVHVINALHPNEPVLEPIVRLTQIGSSGQPIEQASANATFELMANKKYTVAGGSTLGKIDCVKGADSVLCNYVYRKIEKFPPETITKERKTIDTLLIPREKVIRIDTLISEVTIPQSELSSFETPKNTKIKSIVVDGDNLALTLMEIVEQKGITEYEKKAVQRTISYDTTIIRIDTTEIQLTNDFTILSEKSSRDGWITQGKSRGDVYIDDTIFVYPKYFHYPPCEWRFMSPQSPDFRRNVPYFQTCFWEVNTVENFNRHKRELKSKAYSGASFIELHPENQYFGYKQFRDNPQKYENRLRRYERRVGEYQNLFARQVDFNLNLMTKEIGEFIIPEFAALDKATAGNDNKLFIILNAYSDKRPITRANYINGPNIDYVAADFDINGATLRKTYQVHVPAGQSLAGVDNDTLSKLRVYYGYKEIFNRLKNYPSFNSFLESGSVLLPDECSSVDDFNKKFTKAKIVFLIEGKQVDPVPYSVTGYTDGDDDYYKLDSVRRINVVVKRVLYLNNKIIQPECCKPAAEPVFNTEAINKENKYIFDRKLIEAEIEVYPLDYKTAETCFYVSFGSFNSKKNAEKLTNICKKNGYSNLYIEDISKDPKKPLFRVFAGKFLTKAMAEKYADIVESVLEENMFDTEVEIFSKE